MYVVYTILVYFEFCEIKIFGKRRYFLYINQKTVLLETESILKNLISSILMEEYDTNGKLKLTLDNL